jgi:beta-N-acetylhexosaminidase
LSAGCDLVLLCNQSAPEGGRDLDGLLDGLADLQAQGRWQPDPGSEARRLALLPQTAPLPWDELMHQPAYLHALERLP